MPRLRDGDHVWGTLPQSPPACVAGASGRATRARLPHAMSKSWMVLKAKERHLKMALAGRPRIPPSPGAQPSGMTI